MAYFIYVFYKCMCESRINLEEKKQQQQNMEQRVASVKHNCRTYLYKTDICIS